MKRALCALAALMLSCALFQGVADAQVCYTIGCATGANAHPPATPTFVYVDTQQASCASGTATCTVSGLTATTANSILVVGVLGGFVSTPGISSVSGGGGTWSVCFGCYIDTSGVGIIAEAYNLTNTSPGGSLPAPPHRTYLINRRAGLACPQHNFRIAGYSPRTMLTMSNSALNFNAKQKMNLRPLTGMDSRCRYASGAGASG